MGIAASFQGVSEFWKKNDALIKEIRDTASTTKDILTGLADRVEAGRKDSQELVANMGKITFKIAQKRETKDRQAELLAEIAETKEKIQKYRDDPTITGLLNTKLSTFYQELGNSYLEESVEAMVTLTEKEVAEIGILLSNAALDAKGRQNMADILNAAVKIGEVALKVAVKLTA